MFILYVQIILNNHYGSYFLWQKIRSLDLYDIELLV